MFFVPSIILADLLGNTCLLARVQKVMVYDWWISIRFVCFVFQGSLLCDRLVLCNNASQIFMIFLILVTCKNKATSASSSVLTIAISFPIVSSVESFSAKLGAHVSL